MLEEENLLNGDILDAVLPTVVRADKRLVQTHFCRRYWELAAFVSLEPSHICLLYKIVGIFIT